MLSDILVRLVSGAEALWQGGKTTQKAEEGLEPGRIDKVLRYPCYANRRKGPPGSHLTFSCLPPPAYFFSFPIMILNTLESTLVTDSVCRS